MGSHEIGGCTEKTSDYKSVITGHIHVSRISEYGRQNSEGQHGLKRPKYGATMGTRKYCPVWRGPDTCHIVWRICRVTVLAILSFIGYTKAISPPSELVSMILAPPVFIFISYLRCLQVRPKNAAKNVLLLANPAYLFTQDSSTRPFLKVVQQFVPGKL